MKTKSKISKAEEVVRYRPKSTIKVYNDKLKAVKDMQVGDKVTLVVTARVKSIYDSDGPYGDGYDYDDDRKDGPICATLQVSDVKEK